MSGKTDWRPLIAAPLPDSGHGLPSGAIRLALRRMRDALLADQETVIWSSFVGVEPDEPPIVRLTFTSSSVMIDEFWCRYFRAQLEPLKGPAWLARAAFFDPDAREVYLKPRQDPVDIETAKLWSLSREPLVEVKIGFNYVHPMRTVVFSLSDAYLLH